MCVDYQVQHIRKFDVFYVTIISDLSEDLLAVKTRFHDRKPDAAALIRPSSIFLYRNNNIRRYSRSS